MEFSDKTKKVVFIIFYTFITILLVINSIRSKLIIDISYTTIFVCIYFKYLYRTILG